MKRFQLAPGFRIELVAAEPEVASPVALAFDERGRDGYRYHRQYQQRREDKKRHSQPKQSQEDGCRREQRVYQRDGTLRGLADHQAIASLKGVVLEEDAFVPVGRAAPRVKRAADLEAADCHTVGPVDVNELMIRRHV